MNCTPGRVEVAGNAYEVTLADDGQHQVAVVKMRKPRGYGAGGECLSAIKPDSQRWRAVVRAALDAPAVNFRRVP